MWETWVRSLGWEDPLEKGMPTQSSILVTLQLSGVCVSEDKSTLAAQQIRMKLRGERMLAISRVAGSSKSSVIQDSNNQDISFNQSRTSTLYF